MAPSWSAETFPPKHIEGTDSRLAERCHRPTLDASANNAYPGLKSAPTRHTIPTSLTASVCRVGPFCSVAALAGSAGSAPRPRTPASRKPPGTAPANCCPLNSRIDQDKGRTRDDYRIVWDFMRHARSRGIPVGPGGIRRRETWSATALEINGRRPRCKYSTAVRALLLRNGVHAISTSDSCNEARASHRVRSPGIGTIPRRAPHNVRGPGGKGERSKTSGAPIGSDLRRSGTALRNRAQLTMNITLDEELPPSPQLRRKIDSDAPDN